MKIFTTLIVDMMKEENLFASQGGPIILAQVGILFLNKRNFLKIFLLTFNLLFSRLKMNMEMSWLNLGKPASNILIGAQILLCL